MLESLVNVKIIDQEVTRWMLRASFCQTALSVDRMLPVRKTDYRWKEYY